MKSRDRLTAVLMLLPSLILLAVFVYGFIGQTFYTSLTNWGQDPVQALALNPVLEFIGFENYRQLFTAPSESRFRQDLVNTFFFTLFFLAGCLGLGLGLAVLLEQNVRGEAFFPYDLFLSDGAGVYRHRHHLALDVATPRWGERAADRARPARRGL